MGGAVDAVESVAQVGIDYNPLSLGLTLTGNAPSNYLGFSGNALQNAQSSIFGGVNNPGLLGTGSYSPSDSFAAPQMQLAQILAAKASSTDVDPAAQAAMSKQLNAQAAQLGSANIAPALQARLIAEQAGAAPGQAYQAQLQAQKGYLQDLGTVLAQGRGENVSMAGVEQKAFSDQAANQQSMLRSIGGAAAGLMG
jgi:hypothetical protein